MYRVAQGQDPAAERRAERSADTFEELATRYRAYIQKKNKSWKQADALVPEKLLPKWAKLPAASITRSDVKQLVAAVDVADLGKPDAGLPASAVFTWALKEEIARDSNQPVHGIEHNKTAVANASCLTANCRCSPR